MVLGVAFTAARVAVERYAPLSGGGGSLSGDWRPSEEGGRPVYRAPYRHGAKTWYSVVVHNDGRWGVTVTGFTRPPSRTLMLLRPDEARITPPGSLAFSDDPSKLVPLTRFRLAPGASKEIMFASLFDDCSFFLSGGGQTYSEIGITYEVFGVSRAMNVGLPFTLSVLSPEDRPSAEQRR